MQPPNGPPGTPHGGPHLQGPPHASTHGPHPPHVVPPHVVPPHAGPHGGHPALSPLGRRHPCTSAFSAPPGAYGPPGHHIPPMPGEPGYMHGKFLFKAILLFILNFLCILFYYLNTFYVS